MGTRYPYFSFLTDYGLEDGFVAACHGVVARLAPHARILDITHLVPPGDVRRGAAVLAQTVPYLPAGVHVAVVDPGVGTQRRAVAIEAGESVFIGPDNGVLSWVVQGAGGARRVHELTNPELRLHPVSRTFHGRDIFVPAAASIAAGLDIAETGAGFPPAELATLPMQQGRLNAGWAEGEVLSVDHFGNVQLSVTHDQLDQLGARLGGALVVEMGRRRLTVPLSETFASVPPDKLVAFTDSAGYVAVAVNSGNAAERLGLPPGAHVRLKPAP